MNCTMPMEDGAICEYKCADGYGINGSAYLGQNDRAVTCDAGTLVWDQRTACTLLPAAPPPAPYRPPPRPAPPVYPPMVPSPPGPIITTTAPPFTPTVSPQELCGANATEICVSQEVFEVTSSLEIAQEFPEGTTGESLLADASYVDSLASSIAASLGLDAKAVAILKIILTEALSRRLGEASARRMQAKKKKKVKVDYKAQVKDKAAADKVKDILKKIH